MLRRVNAALFEAPPGARIQIVAEAQGNNGVNDARFEYAGQILDRETILGLPGCTFTVGEGRELFEAFVVFDPAAPGSARYDLFEVENGVRSSLDKSTKASDSSPLIGFTIDPVVEVAVAGPRITRMRPPAVAKPAAKRPAARKAAKKTAAKKRTAKKKTAKKKTVKRKATKKKTAKRKTSRKPPK